MVSYEGRSIAGRQADYYARYTDCRWANAVGKDEEYGGIISYADALGETPRPIDWFKETNSLWRKKYGGRMQRR